MKALKIFFLATLCCVWMACSHAAEKKYFNYVDIAGKHHELSDYKGKWVFVNYWATWCPPCLEEVPDLVALHDSRHLKDAVVIGVAIDYDNEKDVFEYVEDMLMSYPIVLGEDQVVEQLGRADVLPTTYIFNPRGQLVKVKHGLVTKQYLEGLIKANQSAKQ